MDLEVTVGAVAKELRAARPKIGEPGDVLSRSQGGCLMHVDRRHVLSLSFPETSEILSVVASDRYWISPLLSHLLLLGGQILRAIMRLESVSVENRFSE